MRDHNKAVGQQVAGIHRVQIGGASVRPVAGGVDVEGAIGTDRAGLRLEDVLAIVDVADGHHAAVAGIVFGHVAGVVAADRGVVVDAIDQDGDGRRVGFAEGVFDLVVEAHRVILARGQRFEVAVGVERERAVGVVVQLAGRRQSQLDGQRGIDVPLIVGIGPVSVVDQDVDQQLIVLVGRHIIVLSHRRSVVCGAVDGDG